jgi:hypothetical protein
MTPSAPPSCAPSVELRRASSTSARTTSSTACGVAPARTSIDRDRSARISRGSAARSSTIAWVIPKLSENGRMRSGRQEVITLIAGMPSAVAAASSFASSVTMHTNRNFLGVRFSRPGIDDRTPSAHAWIADALARCAHRA